MGTESRESRAKRDLSQSEEIALFQRWEQFPGNREIQEEILAAYKSFVWHQARRYVRRCRRITLDDLVSIGLLVMFEKAVPKFDLARGYRFTTFLGKILAQRFSEERNLQDWIVYYPKGRENPDPWLLDPVSLDIEMEATDGGGTLLGESIPDSAPGPRDEALANEAKRLLDSLMAELKPRERLVIELRYGPSDLTLREAGSRLGVTLQRAQQIEAKALRKLRLAGQQSPLKDRV